MNYKLYTTMLTIVYLLTLVLVGTLSQEYRGIGTQPGPQVVATRGEPWPLPQQYNKNEDFFVLRPAIFRFVVNIIFTHTLLVC